MHGSPSCPRRGVRAALAVILAAVALSGCGGAYAEAIGRGDKFAAAGLWDEAAAAYEQARRIDPQDPEAGIKLKQARRKQSEERLAKGKALIARGELINGLTAIQDAARLDPDNAAAQAALADANAEAVREAEELLENGEPRKAFEITALVLKASPRDPRAKRLDSKVRDTLAESSYTRAEGFEKRSKLGNALLEFAAALEYQPDYRDAKLRVGKVKLALEQELMFYVVLERFADATSARDFAQVLSVDLLSQSFDPQVPLRVVDKLPPGKKNANGMRLLGKFEGYQFKHDKDNQTNNCKYQCGIDRAPNPDYEPLRNEINRKDDDLKRIDDRLKDKQKEFERRKEKVDEVQKEIDRKQDEFDKYLKEYETCMDKEREKEKSKPGSSSSSACSSEESRRRSAESNLDYAKRNMESPRRDLEYAQRQMDDVQKEYDRLYEDLKRLRDRFRNMTPTIDTPRICTHEFLVSMHTLSAEVTVRMTAEQLEDKVKVLDDQPFPFRLAAEDRTFAAEGGVCPELSAGDPLQLPSEKDVKLNLVTQAIGGVREKVISSYERYRQRFLADARREEAEGIAEEAVEAYVRYLLSGPKSLNPESKRQIADFLARTRGFGKIDALPGL